MESEPIAADQAVTRIDSINAVLFALIVIPVAFVAVAKHWSAYHWLERGLAVIFLTNLAVFPLRLVFSGKKWLVTLRAETTLPAWHGYMCVGLAIWLFGF
ncbi:MAG TPA: hypothetical protein VKL40_06810 [Candidatus Angelobacter sp.]|nr:hypothetical protein [Candidatus Angelobacter sp.]